MTQNYAIFFKRGIYKLVECWKMIVQNGVANILINKGDFFKKQLFAFFSKNSFFIFFFYKLGTFCTNSIYSSYFKYWCILHLTDIHTNIFLWDKEKFLILLNTKFFHSKKVLLSIWWDYSCIDVVYFELLPVGQTIDSKKYRQ